MAKYPTPLPVFDTLENLVEQTPPTHIKRVFIKKDFALAKDFLQQYNGNVATYNAYRREIDRLLHI